MPVIGLLQAGEQAMADRFTYLPQIGLAIAVVWGMADLCGAWSSGRWVCSVASALMLAMLTGCAWRQTSFRHNSKTLWTHAVACTLWNGLAQTNLGAILADEGRTQEAIEYCRTAIQLQPDNLLAHNNLGVALARGGRMDEALRCYARVLEIKPEYALAHANLGKVLASCGRLDEAIVEFRRALKITDSADAHYSLGNALSLRSQFDEALVHYQKAVEFKPDGAGAHCGLGLRASPPRPTGRSVRRVWSGAEARVRTWWMHNGLGMALCHRGRPAEALAHYRKALAIKPDDVETH